MQKINSYNFFLINIIFMMLPLSLILGNFATNLNMLILFLLSFIYFIINKKKISLQLNIIDKIILIFFLYTLITLVINYFEKLNYNETLHPSIFSKTFFFQRYLVIYFLIRFLLEKKILQIKWFNISCIFCVCFVCLDIFYQFLFGFDFFGIQSPSSRHYSAIFGDELIAGGYIQKFSLFLICFLSTHKKNSKFKTQYLLPLVSILILVSIILSGNRMPVLLFILSFAAYTFFLSFNFKKLFFKILSAGLIIFFFLINTNNNLKIHFNNFYKDGLALIKITLFEDLSKAPIKVLKKPYVTEFNCSKQFINKNPISGGGIRSYRTHPGGCLTHSHNYYLEILVDLGLVGLAIILSLIFILGKKIKSIINNKKKIPLEIMPFLLILLTEFFPFRTSGSFFSTNNAVIIFVFLSVLISSISFEKNAKK